MTKNFKQYTKLMLVENCYFERHVEHNLVQILAIDVVAV